jgi:hypothetical protein
VRNFFLILLLIGCNTAKRTSNIPLPTGQKAALTVIRLDGSKSRIINGDGKGFIKTWNWRQIKGSSYPIDNSSLMVTQTKVGSGNFAWELTGIDNLGNVGKDTFYYPKRK